MCAALDSPAEVGATLLHLSMNTSTIFAMVAVFAILNAEETDFDYFGYFGYFDNTYYPFDFRTVLELRIQHNQLKCEVLRRKMCIL